MRSGLFWQAVALAWVAVCCAQDCPNAQVHIAESVPFDTAILAVDMTTYDAWMQIINNANNTLDIAAYYVTLTQGSGYPVAAGGYQGQDVFDGLRAAHARGVHIRLVQNTPSASQPDTDAQTLLSEGVIELRTIDWPKIEKSGILHTKLMVADGNSAYIGSANCDWRSLTQVKELGVYVNQCTALCTDAQRIFETYWLAAAEQSLPNPWPESVAAMGNLTNPLSFPVDAVASTVYLAASPPDFAAGGRTDDLTALLNGMHSATSTISVQVMDYYPTTQFMPQNSYWPFLDTALRDAAYRGVEVRFLAGVWNHTSDTMYPYLKSLNELTNITVRKMIIPDQHSLPTPAPYSRVNHAKFMVTEKECYIGTSNWSGDYYEATGGVSYNWRSKPLVDRVTLAFNRDWNGKYTQAI